MSLEMPEFSGFHRVHYNAVLSSLRALVDRYV